MDKGIALLEAYVNLPSWSHEPEDAAVLAGVLKKDLEALGFEVQLIQGKLHGPVVSAVWGKGPRQLLLMGHYDTVFPRHLMQPFRAEGDLLHGSGVWDMKGGLAVMMRAMEEAIKALDPSQCRLQVLLNADEEVGSVESKAHILAAAKQSFAAISFEPNRGNKLTVERKGVTNFHLSCEGIGGHSGAFYKQGVNAIDALIEKIQQLYQLRDHDNDISLNIGVIEGGTAENVIASNASVRGEFRSYDPEMMLKLEERARAICLAPGPEGSKFSVSFGAHHSGCMRTEASLQLFERAAAIAKTQGRTLELERSGGAGDISFAAKAGIPVLDGLGLEGGQAHTDQEYAVKASMPLQMELATKLILSLFHEA